MSTCIQTLFCLTLWGAPIHPGSGDHLEYGWSIGRGSPKYDQARGLTLADDGSAFVVGSFSERFDCDPTKKKQMLRTKGEDDILVTSYGSGGDFRQGSGFGGNSFDFAFAAASQQSGDIVFTGDFLNRVDFDPSPAKAVFKARSRDNADVFVAAFRPDGSYHWTKAFGGRASEVGWGIAVDGKDDIVVTGQFEGKADFDPGRGKDRRTSGGTRDVFIIKLSSRGTYRWTHAFGGPGIDVGWSVALDGDDNVYVTGDFRETVDFDPRGEHDVRRAAGATDVFVIKLSPDGEYLWTRTIGGVDREEVNTVAIDEEGNLYICGFFFGRVDFDPTDGVDERSSLGSADIFLTALRTDGSYRWTRTFGGSSGQSAHAVAVGPGGELALVGLFDGTVDFDPGEGTDERSANGGADVFLTRLTRDGDYLGTLTVGGPGRDLGLRVAYDPDGNIIYIVNTDSPTIDLDPTSGVDLYEGHGHFDFAVTKLYRGSCEAVERHSLTVKKDKIIAEVRALIPGGRVTVECTPTDPPGEPIEKNVSIDGDNTGTYKLKKLAKGEYACAITKVRDADGDIVCDEPAGKRVVNVK